MSRVMIFWACLIGMFGTLRLTLGQDVPADITQSLMALLQEESTIRTRLEHDLAELGAEINTLTALTNNGRYINILLSSVQYISLLSQFGRVVFENLRFCKFVSNGYSLSSSNKYGCRPSYYILNIQ